MDTRNCAHPTFTVELVEKLDRQSARDWYDHTYQQCPDCGGRYFLHVNTDGDVEALDEPRGAGDDRD